MVREEKRGCRERSSNFSLRSTKIGWSSSDRPRFKVGVLSEGYKKFQVSPRSHVEGLGSRNLRVQEMFAELPQVGSQASRGRDSSYFGYFPFYGLFG